MRNRKSEHKRVCKNESDKRHNLKVYQFIRDNGGWDAWNMVLVEKVQYNERCELLARERYYIETLGASLNCCIPGRTQREYNKAYREKNREKEREYKHKNREKLNEYQRERYHKNKDKIREYKREYQRERYHKNKEKVREYMREYYQKNRMNNS